MIDSLLMAAFGILITLMGYGKVRMSRDPVKNQEYLNKYGNILRICGIIMIGAGLILVIANMFGG
jgi:hypothetical protein